MCGGNAGPPSERQTSAAMPRLRSHVPRYAGPSSAMNCRISTGAIRSPSCAASRSPSGDDAVWAERPHAEPGTIAHAPRRSAPRRTDLGDRTMKLDAYWMPFTANRQFKKAPRLLARSSGMHYWTQDGRQILDGVAGLWCVNAGHARPKIVQAIQDQAAEMDFAPPFQMAHPKAFELAEEAVKLAPAGMTKLFFTNSGSESVDTALKMALAYHRVRGEGQRTRLIGRERGYHGVNFGGISVGGIVSNRKMFGAMLAGVDHIRHTH